VSFGVIVADLAIGKSWISAAFPALFSLIAAWTSFSIYLRRRNCRNEALRWSVVDGMFKRFTTSTGSPTLPLVDYTYQVNGRTYKGSATGLAIEDDRVNQIGDVIDALPAVRVRYDPANPMRSRILNEDNPRIPFEIDHLAAAKLGKEIRMGTTERVPLTTNETSTSAGGRGEPRNLPMMPVRDMVVIPGMVTPFVVGRESSVRALEYANAHNGEIFLATQHDANVECPKASEISQFGCICRVVQSIRMDDGHFKVLVEGIEMAKAVATDDSKGFFFATVQNITREMISTRSAV